MVQPIFYLSIKFIVNSVNLTGNKTAMTASVKCYDLNYGVKMRQKLKVLMPSDHHKLRWDYSEERENSSKNYTSSFLGHFKQNSNSKFTHAFAGCSHKQRIRQN